MPNLPERSRKVTLKSVPKYTLDLVAESWVTFMRTYRSVTEAESAFEWAEW